MRDWRGDDIWHWPTPFVQTPLDLGRSALVIVDVQRYWTDPSSPFAALLRSEFPDLSDYFYSRLETIVTPALSRALAIYRERRLPVIHITSGPSRRDARDLPAHLQRRIQGDTNASGHFELIRVGSDFHQVHPPLAPVADELVLNKTTRSAFHSTRIDHLLKNLGVSHLVVGGLATNGCVDLTARDASDLGYETYLLEDGCVTFEEASHVPVLRTFARVFGSVMSLSDLEHAHDE